MAFRFNFSTPCEDDTANIDGSQTSHDVNCNGEESDTSDVSVAPFVKIDPSNIAKMCHATMKTKTYKISDKVEVTCYDSDTLEENISRLKADNSAVVKAVSAHSDLIPSVYEGGMTVWECGIDLAKYIVRNVEFQNKSVLELGCGAGLPGICAMKQGASEVHFQDYNVDVMELYTIPSVLELNDVKTCKLAFYAGDWLEMSLKAYEIIGLKFDVILTAESIYNPNSYKKLHQCFSTMLERDGQVYIAAKSNYFGVGGGTRSFEEFVRKQEMFDLDVIEEISADIPREIIKLNWKRQCQENK